MGLDMVGHCVGLSDGSVEVGIWVGLLEGEEVGCWEGLDAEGEPLGDVEGYPLSTLTE